jgi:hypothetical protein
MIHRRALHPGQLTWMIVPDSSVMDIKGELPERIRRGSVKRVLH